MSETRTGRTPAAMLGLLSLAVLLAASCRRVDRAAPDQDDAAPAARAPQIVTTEGGIEMVLIPGGRFKMGSTGGEPDEAPVHEVRIDPFLIDRYELTQEQAARLAKGNPYLSGNTSHFKGSDRPVEMISWDIAALFCNERSRKEGFQPCYDEETAQCDYEADGYRLPTEAEWEYAARARAETDYSFGPDPRLLRQHAWYADNASETTHPVGQKKPNPWGLYDMYGNVAEWCNDMYQEDYYDVSPAENPRGPDEAEQCVLRGGAWNSSPNVCRSASRAGEDPGFQDACFARDAIGFRCARRAPQDGPGQETPGQETPGQESPEDPEAPAAGEDSAESVDENTDETTDGAPASPSPGDQSRASSSPDAAGEPPRGTGFLYSDVYLQHKTPAGHPECPERLAAILRRLKQSGLLEELTKIEANQAERKWLTAVHTEEYLDRVERSCREGLGYVDTPDAPASRESYDVALTAAGGVLRAVDAVMEGGVRNAFCAVRPPGHHALSDGAMGFCLLNNVAVAARYLQKRHKLQKVLIVDWDVHHGNGTQAIFYDDPTVLYFSVHQYPFYPGTGSRSEKGAGEGAGYTVNVPLPAGSGDREFQEAFEEKLQPAAADFRPQFVLVSAGFDAHENDLLGGMKVTTQGFAELTRIVKQIAQTHCDGRLVSVLEGGYGLEGLAASTEAHLRVLMN